MNIFGTAVHSLMGLFTVLRAHLHAVDGHRGKEFTVRTAARRFGGDFHLTCDLLRGESYGRRRWLTTATRGTLLVCVLCACVYVCVNMRERGKREREREREKEMERERERE